MNKLKLELPQPKPLQNYRRSCRTRSRVCDPFGGWPQQNPILKVIEVFEYGTEVRLNRDGGKGGFSASVDRVHALSYRMLEPGGSPLGMRSAVSGQRRDRETYLTIRARPYVSRWRPAVEATLFLPWRCEDSAKVDALFEELGRR